MIGFWILILVLTIGLAIFIGGVIYSVTKKEIIALLVGVAIIVLGIMGGNWWMNNTASGLRMRITWQAEMNIGLHRNIQVFTATGVLVYEYEGRFDVDQNENRIIIDIINENNEARRVYVSAPAGVVIISEILE